MEQLYTEPPRAKRPAITEPAVLDITPSGWNAVLEAAQGGPTALQAPYDTVFGPLLGVNGKPVVFGQLGQSLDGRIATETGHSKYINGKHGFLHLHCLRAVADAVVVGVGTAIADDPQLTVRHIDGAHPARVVIDPSGRLPAQARLLEDDGTRRIIVTARRDWTPEDPSVELIHVPRTDGRIAPPAIVSALADLGFHRILIEGGAFTLSAFLKHRALQRLHLIVSPVIIGCGTAGLSLNPIAHLRDALRPGTRAYRIGEEVLFDCDLSEYAPSI